MRGSEQRRWYTAAKAPSWRFPEDSAAVRRPIRTKLFLSHFLAVLSDTGIVDLALLPDFRGWGIGSQILDDLARQADRSRRSLSIHVEAFNTTARRLYERFGFTLDLDLVTESAAQDELVEYLESMGYETLHRSPGYSNHLSSNPVLGRIDFVYVAGDTAERIFTAARSLPGPGGVPVPVVSPEHLAAMKVLAMANDPTREAQDLADLRYLLRLPGIDREFVRQSFARHGRLSAYARLVEEP